MNCLCNLLFLWFYTPIIDQQAPSLYLNQKASGFHHWILHVDYGGRLASQQDQDRHTPQWFAKNHSRAESHGVLIAAEHKISPVPLFYLTAESLVFINEKVRAFIFFSRPHLCCEAKRVRNQIGKRRRTFCRERCMCRSQEGADGEPRNSWLFEKNTRFKYGEQKYTWASLAQNAKSL